MPSFNISQIRKNACAEVIKFFEGLPAYAYTRLYNEEIPEHDRKSLKDPNIAAWKIFIDCEGTWQEIIVALKSTFPDTIPRIYLINPPKLIPHVTVSRDNHLCSINTNEVYINSSQPRNVILDTLRIASERISEGLNNRNTHDFDSEFHRYWINDANSFCLSLIEPGGISRVVHLFNFKPAIGHNSYLLADTKEIGERWLKVVNRELIAPTQKALYLNLPQPMRPPFPSNNLEVKNLLESVYNTGLKKLYNFLKKNKSKFAFIVFSFEVDEKSVFGGWRHDIPLSSGKRPLVNGFRDKSIRGKNQLTSAMPLNPITKFMVERIDSNRLHTRVGNEKASKLAGKHVVIIGCGSIGSKIALTLALSGIDKLTLIDNDLFSIENLARHICSIDEISEYKAKAVAKEIQNKLPHIDIKPMNRDCYDVLRKDVSIFSDADLVISATADRNLDMRINQFSKSYGNGIPVMFTWTEIFGFATHSILSIPGKGGCLSCTLDLQYEFKHRVITLPNSETIKHDSGCGSSFLPYSALDSDSAANTASRLALSYLNDETTRSTRCVYLGDLDQARKNKFPISKEFELVGSNRVLKSNLPIHPDCDFCKK